MCSVYSVSLLVLHFISNEFCETHFLTPKKLNYSWLGSLIQYFLGQLLMGQEILLPYCFLPFLHFFVPLFLFLLSPFLVCWFFMVACLHSFLILFCVSSTDTYIFCGLWSLLFLQKAFYPFLSSSSTSAMHIWVGLMVSLKSYRISSLFFMLCSFCSPDWIISNVFNFTDF